MMNDSRISDQGVPVCGGHLQRLPSDPAIYIGRKDMGGSESVGYDDIASSARQ